MTMEIWQSCLVGFGVTVLSGLIGCLCYYYYRVQYHKNLIENDEEQYNHSDDSFSYSMNENEKKRNASSLDLAVSPSPPPPPPQCLTELSAPPVHFFLRYNSSRQVPLPPPVVCPLNNANDIRRCISLSPFLGQKPPSPDMTIIDSHSPSPTLSKTNTSWSSWKRKS